MLGCDVLVLSVKGVVCYGWSVQIIIPQLCYYVFTVNI
jgi:hypothetical protein